MRSLLAVGLLLALGVTTVPGCTGTPPQSAPVASTSRTPEKARASLAEADDSAQTPPPVIDHVRVDPKTLNTAATDRVRISFSVDQSADIRLDLVADDGRIVRELELGDRPQGACEATWDGTSAEGVPVVAGVYRYVIRAKGAAGESIHDPSLSTGGDELAPHRFTFDQPSGLFTWTLPRAARVRLRMGLTGFPHLRTAMDWEPMEAGEHQYKWDGKDASGLIRLSGHQQLQTVMRAFALPDNSIIVAKSPTFADTQVVDPSYPPEVWPEGEFHARHARSRCGDFPIKVSFLDPAQRAADGIATMSGQVPVRVEIDAACVGRMIDSKFEVAFYEDLTPLFEEEDGTSPFTFLWDTSKLSPGVHLLTVNALGYDDHYGVVTTQVRIGGVQ